MVTFVLSGAANFGAMQAGALEVLLDRGLVPEMVVGTSAGALNALYIAYDPTPSGAERIQDLWRQANPREVGIPRPLKAVRNLVRGQDSLVDNTSLISFMKRVLPRGIETYGDLAAHSGIRAYAVAVGMETGEMRVFGDDPNDLVLDGALASTAIPPYFPPWSVDGIRYLDGGVYSKLPLLASIDRGASQIVALDVSYAMGGLNNARGVLGISGYALSMMVEHMTAFEIQLAQQSGAGLRLIQLEAPEDVTFWDYEQAERLIDLGRQEAARSLAEDPLAQVPSLRFRIRQWLAQRRKGEPESQF